MIANRRFNTKNTTIKLINYKGAIYEFAFYQANKKMGYLSLHPVVDEPNWFETHSMISNYKHRGGGLGLFMYSVVADWCAKNGFNLQSYPVAVQSADAVNLWMSRRLRQRYLVTTKLRPYIFGGNIRVWVIRPKSTNLLRNVQIVELTKNTSQLVPKWHPAVAADA